MAFPTAASKWMLGRPWCKQLLGVWVAMLLTLAWMFGHLYPGVIGVSDNKHSSKNGNNGNNGNDNGISLRDVHPPVARREETRVIYAGVAPEGWDMDIPRQAETSNEPMMDPPIGLPDPYGWLRDDERKEKEVLDHIQAENNYTEFMTKHLKGLRQEIYDELLSYVTETDTSLPRPDREYYYYRRTVQGQSYALHCRAPVESNPDLKAKLEAWDGLPNSPLLRHEQVYLDENEICEEKSYCGISSLAVSPSQKLLAYTADFTGDEVYHLIVLDMEKEVIVYEDEEMKINRNVEWGADDTTLFYLGMDNAQRPNRLFRKLMPSSETNATEPDDELLLEEDDVLFWMGHGKSMDDNYMMVAIGSSETSEMHYLDLTKEGATLNCIEPRESGVLYSASHRKSRWWITSNKDKTPNMKLFTLSTSTLEERIKDGKVSHKDNWEVVTQTGTGDALVDGSTQKDISGVSVFEDYIVLSGREGGIPRIWVMEVDAHAKAEKITRLEFEEAAHDAALYANWEYNTTSIVVTYESLVTPYQHLEVSLSQPNEDRTILMEKDIPGYERSDYECDRKTVPSRDGKTQIPISMVYRKDVMKKAKMKGQHVNFHLYAYGTYGVSIEDDFSSSRLPLLDRGIVYVIVHVRGGGEMGRQWYEEPDGGKYLCKKNTFNDFIDVAKWVSDVHGWTTPKLLSCEGRSAGGMTIGASINQAPELFRMAILGVPFVDLMATMIDASIPLTAGEWEEWGNPNEEKFYEYMKSYSPMNNVKKDKTYPSCLLLGGLYDSRVAYWEPAKLAQTLRHIQSKTTRGKRSGPACLKIELSAGHFSASDRYKYLESKAFDYAFLLDQVGLNHEPLN